MSTEAQTLANKRNVQKSTGPRTPAMSPGAPEDYYMQNKPNFRNAEMNITSAITKDYENIPPAKKCENKPNQTQFQPKNEANKPNFNPKPR